MILLLLSSFTTTKKEKYWLHCQSFIILLLNLCFVFVKISFLILLVIISHSKESYCCASTTTNYNNRNYYSNNTKCYRSMIIEKRICFLWQNKSKKSNSIINSHLSYRINKFYPSIERSRFNNIFRNNIASTTVATKMTTIPKVHNEEQQQQTISNSDGMDQETTTKLVLYNSNNINNVTVFNKDHRIINWFRLDDGVMGGKSNTDLKNNLNNNNNNDFLLYFHGTINTNGGGFASIRTKIAIDNNTNEINSDTTKSIEEQQIMKGFKIRYKGDGKTYKFLITNRVRGMNNPSWQIDIPTLQKIDRTLSNSEIIKYNENDNDNDWEEMNIYLNDLIPYYVFRSRNSNSNIDSQSLSLDDITTMNEMGIMLSLKLSNGNSNPMETFGIDIFPFHLLIQSIEIFY